MLCKQHGGRQKLLLLRPPGAIQSRDSVQLYSKTYGLCNDDRAGTMRHCTGLQQHAKAATLLHFWPLQAAFGLALGWFENV